MRIKYYSFGFQVDIQIVSQKKLPIELPTKIVLSHCHYPLSNFAPTFILTVA